MNIKLPIQLTVLAVLLMGLAACDEGTPGAAAGTTGTPGPTPSAKTSAATTASAAAAATAPKGDVFFVQPTDGATVFPDFSMAFGVKDIEIAARGAKENTKGFIVVIVDGEPVAEGQTVPTDDKHLVFDKGDVGGDAKLSVGKHKLTIQFIAGDGKAWGKALSQTIEVEVIEDQGERSVAFLDIENGAKVKSPVKLKFDVKGMKIEIAGKDPKARTSGHHHVLVGHDATPSGTVIPADATHIHFGKGQTEAEVELPKGTQKLTLQFADGSHNSYGPEMSQTITVEVE